jgi:hypothetical protein
MLLVPLSPFITFALPHITSFRMISAEVVSDTDIAQCDAAFPVGQAEPVDLCL